MEMTDFNLIVGECLSNIKEHVSKEAGLRLRPAIRAFLAKQHADQIVKRIADATSPAVRRLFAFNEDLESGISSLIGPINTTSRGIFARILTKDADKSAAKVYVGSATDSQQGGVKGRILGLQREMRSKRTSTTQHYRFAHEAEWRTNWAVLAAFTTQVEDEMMIITQTILTILLGSCPSSGYSDCRPKQLKPCPPGWGLNEKAPLCLDGMPRYRKNVNDRNRGDWAGRPTIGMSGKGIASKASHHRQSLLSNGGPIRVYVLLQAERVMRFSVTLMTARDGAHVDIVIPLLVGLEYGLQKSRTVDIHIDVGAGNHFAPFATKAAYNSNARKLGIMISGTYAVGPHKGTNFTRWIQSSTQAAIGKAEKLLGYLHACHSQSSVDVGEMKRRKFVTWSNPGFVHVSESQGEHRLSLTRTLPGDQPAEEPNVLSPDEDRRMYDVSLAVIKALQQLAIPSKIRTAPGIRSYFKAHSAEYIAATISRAVRSPVADILLSANEFTVSRLVSLGGNIKDSSQGVYADIVTNESPGYFKIYVGAAGSIDRRKFGGLRRRIQEHLRYARSKSRLPRAQSGIPHSDEVTKPGAHPNFVILLRFEEPVPIPLVHIAEALMAIFFASWDNPTYLRLRPAYLAMPCGWGLNKANPLDFAIVSSEDRSTLRLRAIESSRRRRNANQIRRIEGARAGCWVRSYLDRKRNNFYFKLCNESIAISSRLGAALDLKRNPEVYVQCDIRTTQHPSAYAERARWESDARRLGISLQRRRSQDPGNGQEAKKWVQCGSVQAVARAERLIGMLED